MFEHSESISEHENMIFKEESDDHNALNVSTPKPYFRISQITNAFSNNSATDCCAFEAAFISDIGV